eukprot:4775202-Pyramimonas_sp.AAC.1
MQRAMCPARHDRDVDPNSRFGVWPARCLCPPHSVECQAVSRACPWARMQRVAPQAPASAAPGCAK